MAASELVEYTIDRVPMETNCWQCDAKLPLVKRLQGELFCSKEHEEIYYKQQSVIAFKRLTETAVEKADAKAPAGPTDAAPANGANPPTEAAAGIAPDAQIAETKSSKSATAKSPAAKPLPAKTLAAKSQSPSEPAPPATIPEKQPASKLAAAELAPEKPLAGKQATEKQVTEKQAAEKPASPTAKPKTIQAPVPASKPPVAPVEPVLDTRDLRAEVSPIEHAPGPPSRPASAAKTGAAPEPQAAKSIPQPDIAARSPEPPAPSVASPDSKVAARNVSKGSPGGPQIVPPGSPKAPPPMASLLEQFARSYPEPEPIGLIRGDLPEELPFFETSGMFGRMRRPWSALKPADEVVEAGPLGSEIAKEGINGAEITAASVTTEEIAGTETAASPMVDTPIPEVPKHIPIDVPDQAAQIPVGVTPPPVLEEMFLRSMPSPEYGPKPPAFETTAIFEGFTSERTLILQTGSGMDETTLLAADYASVGFEQSQPQTYVNESPHFELSCNESTPAAIRTPAAWNLAAQTDGRGPASADVSTLEHFLLAAHFGQGVPVEITGHSLDSDPPPPEWPRAISRASTEMRLPGTASTNQPGLAELDEVSARGWTLQIPAGLAASFAIASKAGKLVPIRPAPGTSAGSPLADSSLLRAELNWDSSGRWQAAPPPVEMAQPALLAAHPLLRKPGLPATQQGTVRTPLVSPAPLDWTGSLMTATVPRESLESGGLRTDRLKAAALPVRPRIDLRSQALVRTSPINWATSTMSTSALRDWPVTVGLRVDRVSPDARPSLPSLAFQSRARMVSVNAIPLRNWTAWDYPNAPVLPRRRPALQSPRSLVASMPKPWIDRALATGATRLLERAPGLKDLWPPPGILSLSEEPLARPGFRFPYSA